MCGWVGGWVGRWMDGRRAAKGKGERACASKRRVAMASTYASMQRRAVRPRSGRVPLLARPAQSYCDGMRAGGPRMKEDTLLSLTVALAQESAECESSSGSPWQIPARNSTRPHWPQRTSSMKMIAGAFSRASRNTSRTIRGPSPRYLRRPQLTIARHGDRAKAALTSGRTRSRRRG